jgi:hypothetical protein
MANPITIVTTEQAPSSKPVSVSKVLTTEWQKFIDVPMYDVPLVGFGSSRRIAPGVAEPSAPVLFTNVGSETEKIEVRVAKAYRPLQTGVTEVEFQGGWTPGSGYSVGANIYLTSTPWERDADPFVQVQGVVQVDAVDINGNVTQFTVVSSSRSTVDVDSLTIDVIEEGVFPEQLMYQRVVLDSGGAELPGSGFSITPDRDDLSETTNVITIAYQLNVEPRDILLLPLNGQFFLSAEFVEMRALSDNNVHATVSFTLGQSEEDQIYF